MRMDLTNPPVPLMLFKNEAFHQANEVFPNTESTKSVKKFLADKGRLQPNDRMEPWNGHEDSFNESDLHLEVHFGNNKEQVDQTKECLPENIVDNDLKTSLVSKIRRNRLELKRKMVLPARYNNYFLETGSRLGIKLENSEENSHDKSGESSPCTSGIQMAKKALGKHFFTSIPTQVNPIPSTVRVDLDSSVQTHLPFSQNHLATQERDSESDVDIETVANSPRINSSVASRTSHPCLPMPASRKNPFGHIIDRNKETFSSPIDIANDGIDEAPLDMQYDAYHHRLNDTADMHNYAKSSLEHALISTLSNTRLPSVKPVIFNRDRLHRRRYNMERKDKLSQRRHTERMRRQRLGDLFTDLSKEIPTIGVQHKVSKIMILQESVAYIRSLEIYLQGQEDAIGRETEKNLSLRAVLQCLQLQAYPRVILLKL